VSARPLTGEERLGLAELEEAVKAALLPVLLRFPGDIKTQLSLVSVLLTIATAYARNVGFGPTEMAELARVGWEPVAPRVTS
jgi:hypothetical protein